MHMSSSLIREFKRSWSVTLFVLPTCQLADPQMKILQYCIPKPQGDPATTWLLRVRTKSQWWVRFPALMKTFSNRLKGCQRYMWFIERTKCTWDLMSPTRKRAAEVFATSDQYRPERENTSVYLDMLHYHIHHFLICLQYDFYQIILPIDKASWHWLSDKHLSSLR